MLKGMAKKYYDKITAEPQQMLWTEVKSLWTDEVKKELADNGYILNEDGTVTKPGPEPVPEPEEGNEEGRGE